MRNKRRWLRFSDPEGIAESSPAVALATPGRGVERGPDPSGVAQRLTLLGYIRIQSSSGAVPKVGELLHKPQTTFAPAGAKSP